MKEPRSNEDETADRQRELIDAAWEQVEEVHLRTRLTTEVDQPVLPRSDSIPGYQILREIHRGGQGVVYQAIQESTKRKVAIKVMKEGPFAGRADKARFEREVQILGALSHPNIVTIHDSGMAAGSFYFVMDYISGQPLDLYMAGREHSVAETLRLFAAICEAVNAAHLRGVIHRDLKPSNIRINAEGQPQILDFGLAKIATAATTGDTVPQVMTVTGQFLGSLPWASPEQAEAIPDKIDIRTDVYSLGVILYHMLTGKFPYDVVGNMRDVLDNILKAEPVKPSTLRHEIDDEVETIVLKCLSKERERRYQTAGELARDVRHYLAGEPIEAKRDSTLYILRKSLRRYKVHVSMAAAFMVLMGMALVVSLMLWSKAAAERDRARVAEEQARGEREKVEQESYHALTALAQRRIAERDFDSARELLAECAPRHRHWEWGWLQLQCHQDLMTLKGHSDGALSVAFSPRGRYLAAGSGDGTVTLWDTRTGEEARKFRGHLGPVHAVAFHPEGKWLASGSDDDTVCVWDVEAEQSVRPVDSPSWVVWADRGSGVPDFSSTICPAGGTPPCLRIQESGNFNGGVYQKLNLTPGMAYTLRIVSRDIGSTPNGAWVEVLVGTQAPRRGQAYRDENELSGILGTTLLARWDTTECPGWNGDQTTACVTQRLTFTAADTTMLLVLKAGQEPPGGTVDVSFDNISLRPDDAASSDTQEAVVNGDFSFQQPDLAPQDALLCLAEHTGAVNSVAFSPDGKWLATASSDATAKLWGMEDGTVLGTFKGHEGWVHSVAFSPDGRYLATGGRDKTTRLWETRSGREVRRFTGHSSTVYSVAVGPGGRVLATAAGHTGGTPQNDTRALVWDLESGVLVRTFTHGSNLHSVVFSPDGNHLVTCGADQTPKLWNVQTGQPWLALAGHSRGIRCAAFSPDGKQVATASEDGTVKLWDAQAPRGAGQLKTAWPAEVASLAFSPDGKSFATAGPESVARAWDMRTGRQLFALRGHTDIVSSVDFSPDGKHIVTGSLDKTARIWDGVSREEKLTIGVTSGGITWVAFGADNQRLAILAGGWPYWSKNGNRIMSNPILSILDAKTGEKHLVMMGGERPVEIWWFTFSPGGKYVSAACGDHAVVWDAYTGLQQHSLSSHPSAMRGVAFSPDDRLLATANGDGTCEVWDVQSGNRTAVVERSPEALMNVAFSPDGRRLATARVDGEVRIWDVGTWREVLKLQSGAGRVRCIEFSPDGTTMVTAGASVFVWPAFSWDENDYPGDAQMPLSDRIELYHRDYWAARSEAIEYLPAPAGSR